MKLREGSPAAGLGDEVVEITINMESRKKTSRSNSTSSSTHLRLRPDAF